MSGAQLSPDFPRELRGAHAQIKEPTRPPVDFRAVYSIHGKTKAESSLLFNDRHPLLEADGRVVEEPREEVVLNPTILRATKRQIPPDPRSRLVNNLSMESIDQFRHRLQAAFENRHRTIIQHHHKSFFKTKGELESFIDQGAVQVDLLPAWQPRHSRSLSVSHALNVTRPTHEFYFDRYNQPHSALQEFGNTERIATSQAVREQHVSNRARKEATAMRAGLNTSSRQSSRNGKVLPFARTFVGPRKASSSVTKDALHLRQEITAFERAHHLDMDLKEVTKAELKSMISAEGVAVPGKEYWDPDECVMKKQECKKEVYMQTARRAMVANDKRPIIQRGKVLKSSSSSSSSPPAFCIVSVYRCPDGVARLDAYNQSDRRTYHLVISKALQEDHDLKPPPRSCSTKRWLAWSKRVLDMLELTDGQLGLGQPPLASNGLPVGGFSLTGEDPPQPPPPPKRRASASTMTMLMAAPPAPGVGREEDEDEEEEVGGGAGAGRRGSMRRRGSVLNRKKGPCRKAVTTFFDRF